MIKWLEDAENHVKSLKDAANGINRNCSVFDETSIFATKLMSAKERNISDIEAIKQNISCYVESWILPNIRKALEEIKKEPIKKEV
jgi:hypothetical protein